MHQAQISYKQSLKSIPAIAVIDYKLLRKLSPETARMAVFQYYMSNKNVSLTARVFGITRLTVYDILRKSREGSLKDRSKAPKALANKTSGGIVIKIIKAHQKTGYGSKRLSKYLLEHHRIKIPFSTVKGILKRNGELRMENGEL